jgi:hypothetical protein
MKKILLGAFASLCFAPAIAQSPITINAGDMPSAGDTLRYSITDATSIDFTTTGANHAWDYTSLTPLAQTVDDYKYAAQVNATYGATISPTAYGYKIADSLPGAPIPIKELYNFFNKKTSPSRFVIEGFAAKIASVPTPINYSDEDEVYYFPLTYPHGQDSSTFKLTYTLVPIGSFSQQGYRKTTVDGWGTIKTPFTASPVAVIRVRSEINEVDSFSFGGTAQGIVRNTVEYKWLANGHTNYPLLTIITDKLGGTETPTSAQYRDSARAISLGVGNISAPKVTLLNVYPNPAEDNITVQVPASWRAYTIHLYDAAGKLVSAATNTSQIKTAQLPAGTYMITVESAPGTLGVARFVK